MQYRVADVIEVMPEKEYEKPSRER